MPNLLMMYSYYTCWSPGAISNSSISTTTMTEHGYDGLKFTTKLTHLVQTLQMSLVTEEEDLQAQQEGHQASHILEDYY